MVDTITLEKPSFYIFPNPTTNTITIRNSSFIESFCHTIQIELYDSQGNLLRNEKSPIIRDYTLDISKLYSGQYYLVLSNEGDSNTFPFIKL
ncbi:MAG: T9SS type A sorting domain-containing protein [Bacteroidales bacterium]|nr:T9SS type A sorting domain-containing protein [Bacteroidales bacterium]